MKPEAHGGDLLRMAATAGRDPASLLDFSVNVRPEGPPEFIRAALFRAMTTLAAYPSPHAEEAMLAAARHHGMDASRFVFGPHVHAEIQQGRRIASGCSRHAQQVAAVGFGFHNGFLFLRLPGRFPSGVLFWGCLDGSPLLRAEDQIGMPLSINRASRMQAAQVSGSVRVVSTAIWLGSGTWMERA